MLTINFRNLQDEQPKDGESVFYIETLSIFGFRDYDFKTSIVEYQWDDENGSAVLYDPRSPEPPEPTQYDGDEKEYPYKLYIGIGDTWCPMDNLKKVFWIPEREISELLITNL